MCQIYKIILLNMIEKLYAKNYKSFETLELNITNINILLGSNSCGKSSITNLLLMLSQTADSYHNYEGIFRLNGEKSSLGEALNLYPDKDSSKAITIGWTLPDNIIESANKITLFTALDSLEDYFRKGYIILKRSNLCEKGQAKLTSLLEEYAVLIYEKYSLFSYENNTSENLTKCDFDDLKKEINKYIRLFNKIYKSISIIKKNNFYKINLISISRFNDLLDILYNKSHLAIIPKKIEYTITYNKSRSECDLKSLKILNNKDKSILEIYISKTRKTKINSEIISNKTLNNSRNDILKNIDLKKINLFNEDSFDINQNNPFANFIRQFITYVTLLFNSELSGNKINHISPLRAFPQRYYLLEKSAQHNALDSNDGSQLAEILKNNPPILEKVNNLFKEFDIKISISKVNDLIYKIAVKQHNVIVELTDVGFGISQVLPIIVQALLCPENSITIIEQPEIHLHPKMQAWLTSIITNISITENKKFIIETHSDILIRRLNIQMLDPDIPFEKKDLNIYHLERNYNGKTIIKNVPFNNIGDISWPDGFMDVEINDAIRLQELKVKEIRKQRELKEIGNV